MLNFIKGLFGLKERSISYKKLKKYRDIVTECTIQQEQIKSVEKDIILNIIKLKNELL